MPNYSDLIKSIELKGYTEADIASFVDVTTKAVQYWKTGKHDPKGEKLRKLKQMAELGEKTSDTNIQAQGFGFTEAFTKAFTDLFGKKPGEFSKTSSEDTTLMLLRIQNSVMNIEAKVDANSKMIKMIFEMICKDNGVDANTVFSSLLSESLSSRLKAPDITHK